VKVTRRKINFSKIFVLLVILTRRKIVFGSEKRIDRKTLIEKRYCK